MKEGKVTEYDKDLQTGFGEKRVGRIIGNEGEEFEIRELDKNLQTGFFEKTTGRIVKTSSSGGSGGGSSDWGWFGIIMGLFMVVAIPYAIFEITSQSLKDSVKNETGLFIALGYGMIVFELIFSRFKWYSILCGLVMLGALSELSSMSFVAVHNIKIDDIVNFLVFFIIPILIEKIRKNNESLKNKAD